MDTIIKRQKAIQRSLWSAQVSSVVQGEEREKEEESSFAKQIAKMRMQAEVSKCTRHLQQSEEAHLLLASILTAAGMLEDARRASAEQDLDSARDKKSDPEIELSRIEQELEAVQSEHRQLEAEKESAEKQLKELMARFKLRKALLHWRHRKLTLSFRSLVTMVPLAPSPTPNPNPIPDPMPNRSS